MSKLTTLDVFFLTTRRPTKRAARSRLPEIGCALLIVVGLILLRIRASSMIEDAVQSTGCPIGRVSPAQIDGMLRGKLPASVSQVDAFVTGDHEQYCEVYARLILPATDVTPFLQTTRIRPLLAAAPALSEFSSLYRRNPWRPDPGVQYFCGRSTTARDYMQYVCADTTDSVANILYITVDYLLP